MSRLEEIYNECECNKKSEILEAMKQYAIECCNASLEKASEEVMIKLNTPKGGIKTFKSYENENGVIEVNKESITNESNIVLL